MLLLRQFSIILFFYLLGEGISYLLPFAFPGSLIGMGLLYTALSVKLVRLHDIKRVSELFLRYMPLFFIPAGVSVMNSVGLIQKEMTAILSVLVLSTLFMLSFIALCVDFFVRRIKDA